MSVRPIGYNHKNHAILRDFKLQAIQFSILCVTKIVISAYNIVIDLTSTIVTSVITKLTRSSATAERARFYRSIVRCKRHFDMLYRLGADHECDRHVQTD